MKKLLTLTAILLISLTGYNQTQQQCLEEEAIQFLNQGNYYQSVKPIYRKNTFTQKSRETTHYYQQ